MEEEGGDDSEMIDAMEGWDSEDGAEDEKKKPSESSASWLIFFHLIFQHNSRGFGVLGPHKKTGAVSRAGLIS